MLDAHDTISGMLVLPAFSVEEFGWRGRDMCSEFVKRGVAKKKRCYDAEMGGNIINSKA